MFGSLCFGAAPFAGTLAAPGLLAATTGVSLSTESALTATGRLAAAATLALSTVASLTVRVDLVADAPQIRLSTTATLSSPYGAAITIGGVNVLGRVRIGTPTIRDVLNDAPNTATLTIEGDPPAVGQAVRITIGSAPPRVLFAGTVQTLDQTYESLPVHRAWQVTAIDDTARANAKRPFGTWVNYSASTIAAYYASLYGFSQAGVQANLPIIARIVFDGTDTFIAALARVAGQIGGYCKIEDNVVYLFLADTSDPPNPLDLAHPPLNNPPITISTDASQLRTRVYGKGYGEAIKADVNVGETLLPIEDGVNFPSAGSEAIAALTADGAQSDRLRFTGVQLQGGGTLVGPGAAPGVAPLLALAGGAGVTSGYHRVSLAFVTANGKSLAGPPGLLYVGSLAGPATAPTAGTPLPGTGPDEGYHDYLVTYVTAYGETNSGAMSNAVYCSSTVGQLAPPGYGPTANPATSGTGPDPGTHHYAVTFLNANGETTSSVASNAVVTSSSGGELGAAGPPSVGTPQLGAGADSGQHSYVVTFVNNNGETQGQYASGIVTTYFGGQLTTPNAPAAAIQVGAGLDTGYHNYRVTWVNAYGETTGGAWSNAVTAGDQLVGQTSPVTPPSAPSISGEVYGGGLTPGPSNYSYQYRLTYVTASGETTAGNYSSRQLRGPVDPPSGSGGSPQGTTGGSMTPSTTYYYLATFTTAYGETLPTSSPSSVTLSSTQNAAQNIGTGSSQDNRRTGTKYYRRTGAAGAYHLVPGFSGGKDTASDASIAGQPAPPVVDTTSDSGFDISFSNSGDGRVTGKKLYRCQSGGFPDVSEFRLVAALTTQTTYRDLASNATIANNPAPPASDSTANPGTMQPVRQAQLTSIPVGPAGVTARKLYRSFQGGTAFLVATLNDNTMTSYLDAMPNANRGPQDPVSNTTGTYYERVPLTGIPIGPEGVTARKLYRRAHNLYTTYKLVAQVSGNTATTYTDSTPNAALGPDAPTSNSTGEPYRRVLVSTLALGPAGTTGRKLYRMDDYSGTYKLVTTLFNNTETTYTDTKANGALGAAMPGTNTTGSAVQKVPLTDIPLGPLGVTARKLYRRFNLGGYAYLVTTLANNTATTYTDTTPNSALVYPYTGANTALGNQIAVSAIPKGASAVTARELYMSTAFSDPVTEFPARRLALTIPDNTTTEATITISDGALAGQPTQPINDTSGLQQPVGQVNPGATDLPLAAATTFLATGGWVVLSGGQVARYTGISGQTLIGIPASGPGAITTTLLYGSQALPSAMLTGVTGVQSIIRKGSAIHIWVQRDDLQAQAEQRARAGGDGIIEYVLTDARRGLESLIARCDADLALFGRPILTVSYATRDVRTKSGKPITITLPGFTLGDPLIIQDVTVTELDVATNLAPRFTVRASSVRFSLEDTLRRLVAAAPGTVQV